MSKKNQKLNQKQQQQQQQEQCHLIQLPTTDFVRVFSQKNFKIKTIDNTDDKNVPLQHGIVNECSTVYVVSKTLDPNVFKKMQIDGEDYIVVYTTWVSKFLLNKNL